MSYKPLKIKLLDIAGMDIALGAMRLPFIFQKDNPTREEDLKLAARLVKAGDDHAKAIRGIVVYVTIEMQTGWMIEFETYRAGVECLSTSSAMHNDLKGKEGAKLAEQKQADLVDKVYKRTVMISYQALRSMYKARRNHRHPDWQIMCTEFIETLPYFDTLIYPEYGERNVNKTKFNRI